MITSVIFSIFKALENFSLSLKDFNILVGLNNNGKSTILDSFRVLEGAYRYSSRLKPRPIRISDGTVKTGYEIPDSSIPIVLQNISTNFSDQPAVLKFRFSNGNVIIIEFTRFSQVKLYLESSRRLPSSASGFRNEFPVKISIVPTLGPLEIDEDILSYDYVLRWSGSRRAPRMFRNIWCHFPEDFSNFKKLVEDTWVGMSINEPERDIVQNKIFMFCEENRISREVCWAGFGFQIWLQLLTHITKAKEADILIVDEPEIYLHPDLQHKVLEVLKSTNTRVVLATHSVEMINEADPSEVVLVDKKQRHGKRITDLDGLQSVANILGSGQNIQLTRLARGKKILFVEGKDKVILTKLSKLLGKEYVFNSELTVVPLEGFSEYRRISNAKWAFNNVLGEQLKIAALFDRDYRCEDELAEIKQKLESEIDFVHILARKEIENYLLCPKAISKAIRERFKNRVDSGSIDGIPEVDVEEMLYKLTDSFKSSTIGQLAGKEMQYKHNNRKDSATLFTDLHSRIEGSWSNLDYRFKIIPGKEFLAFLNEHLQTAYKINLTTTSIINSMDKDKVDCDMIHFINELELFKLSK